MNERRLFLQLAVGLALGGAVSSGRSDDATTATDATARPLRWLAAMARLLYPHNALPDATYERVAAALLERATREPALRTQLDAGIAALDADTGGDWLAATPEERLLRLAAAEASPFFQTVRMHTMLSLYADPAIWEGFGYGGDAWARGGYVNDVGDLDWLPEPEAPR